MGTLQSAEMPEHSTQDIVYTDHQTLFTEHCSQNIVHRTLITMHCLPYIVHFELCTVH